jgi:protein-S-isoprenylcysteine O-methyltransferase Ste14
MTQGNTLEPGGHPPPQGPDSRSNIAGGIAMRLGAIVVTLAVQAALLFGGAGTLSWTWAWVYLGISLATLLVNGAILLRISPETIAERGHPREIRRWDKVVSGIGGISMYLVLPLVAGLDARFGWTPTLSLVWHAAGAVVLTVGYGVTAWAMDSNAYFSTSVRIQSERGQTVCRSGPYRFVRHPGYVGYTLQSLGMCFLLGSLWALLPALAAAIAMTIRTVLEDRMLQAELTGYREYALEVRYRLVPGIW